MDGQHVFICEGTRSPIGRYAGALASLRADDLAAHPIRALMQRLPQADWAALDEIYYGCANQAGEDNRNVARMAGLLAGLPVEVPAATINRLCGSSLDAIGIGARAIASGAAEFVLAGGVESMSRAPFVMPKASAAFTRDNAVYDTTIGWRFVNPRMKAQYGIDSMPETAENVAREFGIARADQDALALRSQARYATAKARGFYRDEITPVTLAGRKGKGDDLVVGDDEHPRATSLEALSQLRGVVTPDGSVTAGNASGVNDGAAALLLANQRAIARHGLTPLARVRGMATAGVAPRIMGIGPAPATRKLLARAGLTIGQIDAIELNEAFAAQALAVTRQLGLPDDAPHVNPNGGAIAIGHPLGASGARLALTLVRQLRASGGRLGIATMCIGVGQGIAILLESV
jgi:acetyl-CoA acyltransferase